jgi:bifunctional non-homologous end joining protein LigD
VKAASKDPEGVEHIEAAGRTIRVTNLDKIMWPSVGFTKRHVLAYYRQVAGYLLPHVVDRPMVLARFPDGIDGDFWFQTECPNAPEWLRTCRIPKAKDPEAAFDYCVIDDEASLLWIANLAALELHPLVSKAESLRHPTSVVFDLDPGPSISILECCKVALKLRDRLKTLGLSSYPKSTGATGLHVYVPLNSPIGFESVKSFARTIAAQLLVEQAELVTDKASRKGRIDKVFIDWAQNNPLRSTVAPYSLRAMPFPTVAAPLVWDEIEAAVRRNEAESLLFLAWDVAARLEVMADPLQAVLTERQRLPMI